jgi:hypothetical protein
MTAVFAFCTMSIDRKRRVLMLPLERGGHARLSICSGPRGRVGGEVGVATPGGAITGGALREALLDDGRLAALSRQAAS